MGRSVVHFSFSTLRPFYHFILTITICVLLLPFSYLRKVDLIINIYLRLKSKQTCANKDTHAHTQTTVIFLLQWCAFFYIFYNYISLYRLLFCLHIKVNDIVKIIISPFIWDNLPPLFVVVVVHIIIAFIRDMTGKIVKTWWEIR